MIWLSGFQLAANGLLRIYGNGWENPIFIPMGFAEFVPEREYGPDDPEYAMYMKFKKDPRRALEGKRRVIDALVDYLGKRYGKKFGGNIEAEIATVYYHYPLRPREYKRKGLKISPPPPLPDDSPSPLRISNLTYEWTTRPIPTATMHRLITALYPTWMFSSITTSLQHTYSFLQATHFSSSPTSTSSLTPSTTTPSSSPIDLGKRAISHGIQSGLVHLRRTYRRPPAPQGHVVLDGLVQVAGDKLRVAMDVTVSFHPEDLNSIIFHKIDVRYVARNNKRMAVIPPSSNKVSAPSPPQVAAGAIRVVVVKSATEQPKTEIIEAAAALQRSNVEKARSFIDKQDQERKKKKRERDLEGAEKEEVAVSDAEEPSTTTTTTTPSPSPPGEKEASPKRTGDDAASSKP
ncbi:hypothetical protein L873DRAFT_1722187 [Choiromyces venosus 120613-1]|uniref:Uncharacterized protein n=1 Tax=Choiromyces venosus 120613-1 TaxID=1336337 RepID=A0A3N4IYF1_9PEZI|nr:hypothetical protein L873DRAFT_1722187 [Choiromyces venosus 120613-1]